MSRDNLHRDMHPRFDARSGPRKMLIGGLVVLAGLAIGVVVAALLT